MMDLMQVVAAPKSMANVLADRVQERPRGEDRGGFERRLDESVKPVKRETRETPERAEAERKDEPRTKPNEARKEETFVAGLVALDDQPAMETPVPDAESDEGTPLTAEGAVEENAAAIEGEATEETVVATDGETTDAQSETAPKGRPETTGLDRALERVDNPKAIEAIQAAQARATVDADGSGAAEGDAEPAPKVAGKSDTTVPGAGQGKGQGKALGQVATTGGAAPIVDAAAGGEETADLPVNADKPAHPGAANAATAGKGLGTAALGQTGPQGAAEAVVAATPARDAVPLRATAPEGEPAADGPKGLSDAAKAVETLLSGGKSVSQMAQSGAVLDRPAHAQVQAHTPQVPNFDAMIAAERGALESEMESFRAERAAAQAEMRHAMGAGRARVDHLALGRMYAPPGATPVRDFAMQVTRRIAGGATRFQIRLDPPELGRVDVSLEMKGDNATVRLVVERSETLDFLSRDARTLERALQEAGIKADAGQMEFTLGEQGREHAERKGENGAEHRSDRATEVLEETPRGTPARTVRTDALLDLMI